MASMGEIHGVFQENIQDLARQAGEQADMLRGRGTRPWNVPTGSLGEGAGLDPLDIAGIVDAFDRDEIDTNYGELLQDGSDPGTVGDAISVKTQGDYVAMMERGFRARHATPVRCLGHALARRRGHSNGAGVFIGGVLKHAQDALKAGQDE